MTKRFGYKINKPKIFTWQDYLDFYATWKKGIKRLNEEIRRSKDMIKQRQREGLPTSLLQRRLVFRRLMASKMYQLLEEARLDAYQRRESERQLQKELAQYPLSFPKCRDVIFHFNKGFLFNPNIPMWVLKFRGRTFYVHHVTSNVEWSTKETPDNNHTKGSIRLRNVSVAIDENGYATIQKRDESLDKNK